MSAPFATKAPARLGSGPQAGLDTETNDKNPEHARLLQICLTLIVPGRVPDVRTTLVDPGPDVEIPAEATAVNGLTIEHVRAEGKPAPEVLDLWVGDAALAIRAGMPLVIQNAPYDLTVLDRECRRYGLPTLADRIGGPIAPVIDPLVLDKQLIKYRKRVSEDQGARCLKTLAQVYQIGWDDDRAHDAEYDTQMALRVAIRMGAWSRMSMPELMAMRMGPFDPPKPMHRNDAHAFRSLADMDLMALHNAQVRWYAEQAESFAQYLRKQANELQHQAEVAEDDEQRAIAEQNLAELEQRIDGMRFDWPLIPYQQQGVLA